MPLHPLETDEPIGELPVPREPDVDLQLMGGCTAFLAMAILTYGLTAWPFMVRQDLYKLSGLALACAYGMVPATVVGALASRFLRLAGACGFFGGSLVTAVFLALRLEQLFLHGEARLELAPDYPNWMRFVLGLVWLIWSAIIALACLPKSELSGPNE